MIANVIEGLALRKAQARGYVNSVVRTHAPVLWQNDMRAMVPLGGDGALDTITLDDVADRLLAARKNR